MSYDDGFYNIQPCDIENMEKTDKEIKDQEDLIQKLKLEMLEAEELVLNIGSVVTKEIRQLEQMKKKRGL